MSLTFFFLSFYLHKFNPIWVLFTFPFLFYFNSVFFRKKKNILAKTYSKELTMTASSRRLQKELSEMRGNNSGAVRVLEVDEANLLRWSLMLYPDREPYNKGAFRVTVDFPTEYPFKPPSVTFATKIYHPNIDDKGQVCLGIILAENWKPATRAEQVMNALLSLIAEPEIAHPLRSDLAEEYQRDKKKFFKNAEEFTKKHAERRD